MKSALCSTCDRQVALGDDDALTCPVCSSPLIETAEEPDDDPSEPPLTSARVTLPQRPA